MSDPLNRRTTGLPNSKPATLCPCCGKIMDAAVAYLDPTACTIVYGGLSAKLRRTVFDLARIMIAAHPRHISRGAIYDALFSHRPDADWPEIKIVDVYLSILRKRIGPLGLCIVNNPGLGWAIKSHDDADRMATLRHQARQAGSVEP